MLKNTAKRIAAATLVGGALAVSPLVLPAAQAAPAVGCSAYSAQLTTTTTVSIVSGTNLVSGTQFVVQAVVTVDGNPRTPAPGGTVTFKYRNATQDVNVVNGVATSQPFTARPGSSPVTATFNGFCVVAPPANLGTSTGRLPIVAGVSATAGGGNPGRPPVVAGVSASGGPSLGGLAATGVDSQTQLFGVLGLGLVTVGGLTLVVRRRRIPA